MGQFAKIRVCFTEESNESIPDPDMTLIRMQGQSSRRSTAGRCDMYLYIVNRR